MSKIYLVKKLPCFFSFNRDDPYENTEVKYKIIQQKDDQVKDIFI